MGGLRCGFHVPQYLTLLFSCGLQFVAKQLEGLERINLGL